MKTKITFYGCDSVTLIRDAEFPDLLEIRLGDNRWETISIWSSNDKPVQVTEETRDRADDED